MRRKYKYIFILMVAIASAIFMFVAASFLHSGISDYFPAGRAGEANNALSLITEPDDGIGPVLEMIGGAKRSVDLVMYELDDPAVERVLAAAGAHVRTYPDADDAPLYNSCEGDRSRRRPRIPGFGELFRRIA
jgi:hypothetical protein